MDSGDVRRALGLAVGYALGIGAIVLVTGDRPGPGFVLGILLAPLAILGLSAVDGPLEERTARIGATVLTAVFLGAVFWLLR